jgi:hypothetical protein
VERESKYGAFKNYIESIFRRLEAFQTLKKSLTMLDFLDRCALPSLDRDACGANA